jgi:hypothetical protein
MLTQNYKNTATASVRTTRVIALLTENLKSILVKTHATEVGRRMRTAQLELSRSGAFVILRNLPEDH